MDRIWPTDQSLSSHLLSQGVRGGKFFQNLLWDIMEFCKDFLLQPHVRKLMGLVRPWNSICLVGFYKYQILAKLDSFLHLSLNSFDILKGEKNASYLSWISTLLK